MGRRAGKSAERQAWQALQAVRDITRPRELVALGMRDSVAQALLSSPVGLVRSEQGKSAIAEAIENEMLGAQRLLNEMLYGVPDPNAMVELSAGTWETLENGNYAANPGGSTIHYSTPWTAESAVESALKKIFDTTPYPTPDVVAWAGELFDEAYSLAGITQKPRLPLPSPEERAEARDPTTPAARLEELAATRRGLLNLVARNPNVSDRLMRRWLSGGPIEAWLNPTTPMLLWEVDSEVWRGWARRALAMAAGARGKLLGSTLEQGIDLAREALWREPLDLRHRVVEAIARLVTPQARAGEGEGG